MLGVTPAVEQQNSHPGASDIAGGDMAMSPPRYNNMQKGTFFPFKFVLETQGYLRQELPTVYLPAAGVCM
jgi:hypothetical protein